jgi:hypothetical protein
MGSIRSTSIASVFLFLEFPRLKVSAVKIDAQGSEDTDDGKCGI